MVREIKLYGDPVLEVECDPVGEEELGSDELKQLVDDMFETMYAAKGVGLAAPQIGVPKRLFIIDVTCGEEPDQKLVLVNPEIVETEGEQVGEEGCLSIPGFRADVKRAFKTKARAFDAEGREFEVVGEELLSRALLHENDHLNGVLFLRHLSTLKRASIQRKIKSLQKKGEWA